MTRKIAQQLACTILLLVTSLAVTAQNKVVVIPLFGDNAASKWLGQWDAESINYKIGDIVGYDGSSFIALLDHTSQVAQFPGSASNWGLVAASGANGSIGAQGPAGDEGPQGPVGNDGATGTQGVAGATGSIGPQGPAGDEGPQGPTGNDGAAGAQGIAGADGTGCSLSACTNDLAALSCGASSIDVACISPNRIFVSTTLVSGAITHSSGATGVAAANAICQDEADVAMLSGSYGAWLSTNTTSAFDTFSGSQGAYELVDGTPVAVSFADLIDGVLLNSINLNATGGAPSIFVWTGTEASGVGAAENCSNWTSNLSSSIGIVGTPFRTSSRWSNDGNTGCQAEVHLYCLEL